MRSRCDLTHICKEKSTFGGPSNKEWCRPDENIRTKKVENVYSKFCQKPSPSISLKSYAKMRLRELRAQFANGFQELSSGFLYAINGQAKDRCFSLEISSQELYSHGIVNNEKIPIQARHYKQDCARKCY
jgi:hypothetical protein